MGKMAKSPEALKKTHTIVFRAFLALFTYGGNFLKQEKKSKQKIGEAVVYVDGSACGKWICIYIRRFFSHTKHFPHSRGT